MTSASKSTRTLLKIDVIRVCSQATTFLQADHLAVRLSRPPCCSSIHTALRLIEGPSCPGSRSSATQTPFSNDDANQQRWRRGTKSLNSFGIVRFAFVAGPPGFWNAQKI